MTFVFFKFEYYKVFKSLFPFLILITQLNARPNEKNVCLEPGCVIAAADIIKSIDETINPCDDFFQFACNDWIKNEFIPEDKSSITNFGKLREDLRRKLRIILESPTNNQTPEYMIKAKNFYKSCTDLKSIEKKSDQPLKDVLEKVGGWPVLNSNWDESKFDWIDQLIKFRKLGFGHDMIYDISVSQDFKNNTIYKIQLDQSDLGLPDRSYLIKGTEDPLVKSYHQLAVNAAVLLGADQKKANEELLESIKFEITLANISLPREERRNFTKLYNLYNIEKLSKIAPNANWLKLFNEIIGVPVTKDDEIIIAVPDFVTAVDNLMAKMNKKTLANFLVWRIVLKSVNSLSKPYRNIYLDFQKTINGNSQNPPRWDYCVQKVSNSMNIGLSSMYVKNYFNPESKKKAVTLVDYLQKELLKILNNVDWMDDKTLSLAIEKAKSFKAYIGYPDELLNDTLINENYANLTLSNENYFENILSHSKYITDKSFKKLRETANKENWKKHASAATVNAFNYLDDNSIEFPAGILQGIFYNSLRPNYLNFAAIGFVIGHELTHSFDDAGKQFDKYGNNVNWWEPDTDLKFKERAQCMIDQYSNFTEEKTKLNINGQATQGENIADNGGMKEALQAYHQWVKDNGEEPSLPGLKKYTNDQLFFISFGNVWCSVERSEYMKKIILSDEHSPGRFRVNGVVQNSKEFSEAFNCPVGSKMNPARKCKVW